MKSARIFKGMVMCLAAVGICLSGAAFAAPPSAERIVHDVALMNGGVLAGQLVDAQSVAKAGESVTLLLDQQRVGLVKTDADGNFAFQGVRGGVYQLSAAGGNGTYRLWAPGTAPQGTGATVLLTAGEDVVRGQQYANGCYYQYQHSHSYLGRAKFLLANPWVVSGIVATAVAVPVGIHNADRGNEPASP